MRPVVIALGLWACSVPIETFHAPDAPLPDAPPDAPAGFAQQAYVKASNTGREDRLGGSVALSADGSTLAVGAYGEASAATGVDGNQADDTASFAGAVYVFTRTGATWTQQAYLKASNAGAGDAFGVGIALSADGSTLAVGAIQESSAATGVDGNQADNSASYAGAVYVFTRTGTTWSQQAYVKASNADHDDNFGVSVALSANGSTLAVGAHGEASAATGIDGNQGDNTAQAAGAAYVFTRSGTTWSQQAYVKASNTDATDFFGTSVALSDNGSTLVVGASGEASAATGINGNQADDTAPHAGAVYVFARTGSTWTQQAYLKASNSGALDHFGAVVALSGDGAALAVSASDEASAATGVDGEQSDNSALGAGAVFVFARTGTTWRHEAYLKASNTDAGDQFGLSLALSDDGSTIAVGATEEASAATGIDGDQASNAVPDAGATYLFARNGTRWSQRAYVKSSNTGALDRYGGSIAVSADGSTMVAGAAFEDSAATGIDGTQTDDEISGAGAVYVFHDPR